VWSRSRDAARIAEVCAALGSPDADVERLGDFASLVATWNTKVNLTGAKDARALTEILFADACVLAQVVPENARVIDVGAGGGAPAIPLALLRPDVSVTLLEPRRLRVAFLRTAIASLGLSDRASVEQGKLVRPEPFAGRFDIAMSRATFAPAEWLERGLALAPTVVVLSGAEPLPDHPGAARTIEREYALPFSGTARKLGLYAVRGRLIDALGRVP
jgi:16S rRNA (guanine527-N7)-methyltransferase